MMMMMDYDCDQQVTNHADALIVFSVVSSLLYEWLPSFPVNLFCLLQSASPIYHPIKVIQGMNSDADKLTNDTFIF